MEEVGVSTGNPVHVPAVDQASPAQLLQHRTRPLPLPELLFQDSEGIAAPSLNANTATNDPSSDQEAPGRMVCPRS